MTWNYRIIRSIDPDGEVSFGIHEVYYAWEKVSGWTSEPVSPCGETAEELAEIWSRALLEAIQLPVLEMEELLAGKRPDAPPRSEQQS